MAELLSGSGLNAGNYITLAGSGIVFLVQWINVKADQRYMRAELDAVKKDLADTKIQQREDKLILTRVETNIEYIKEMLDRRLPRSSSNSD